MQIGSTRCARLLAAALLALGSLAATADDSRRVRAQLSGYEEVPALNTTGSGRFDAKFSGDSLTYTLSYRGLEDVTQAHIHFGQKGVNAAIIVFLCTNLGNAPVTVPTPPPCPSQQGTVEGVLTAADVFGPSAQGLPAGDFAALGRAIRAGVAYVNVHTLLRAGGEIRGQINDKD